MSQYLDTSEKERLTALVYGDTFALYDDKAFSAFLAPLQHRLEVNKISLSSFKGKRCLDAGCGGGRGTVLMAQAGASSVTAVDLSEKNLQSTCKRVEAMGIGNVVFHQASLMELPFRDEDFDVVWCNGVVHHMSNPDIGLQEITRVLRTDGRLWLYLYGSGGIYWHIVRYIRSLLKGVDIRQCILQLRLMDEPVGRIAEWMDDWFVPYLRAYTSRDVVNRLNELGYLETHPLKSGMFYDTSHRRHQGSVSEQELMGEGDLRFWCIKHTKPQGNAFPLPDPPDGFGSPYEDADSVHAVDPFLVKLDEAIMQFDQNMGPLASAYHILLARSLHVCTRSMLESNKPFDMSVLIKHIQFLIDSLCITM